MKSTDKHKKAISEIDVPPDTVPTNEDENYTTKIVERPVAKVMANILEQKAKYADRMERHVYKKHELNLLIGLFICLWACSCF